MSRQEIIADTIATHWNVRDELKTNTLEELQQIARDASLPFAVCAINVTGDLNLGMMVRTACLMGAERFIVYGRHGFDRRSTVGAQNYIDIVKAGSIARNGSLEIDYDEFHPTMNSFGYHPVFIETGGRSLYEFNPVYGIRRHTKPCLVFGNEGLGIEPSLLRGEEVYSIPQRGVLRSLNVCAAASIAIAYTSNYFVTKQYY